jgi:hypothetical protein
MTGLATLTEAPAYAARGGGGGARPTDPSSLAARALNAAMGDDRETALKLYDYGMENYGTAFVTAYNGLRDSRELGEAGVTPSRPGVLKQVIDTLKVGDGNAPVELPDELPFAKTPDRPQVQGPPWQTNGVELERATPGSAYRESIIPTPGQPIVVPDAPRIPVVRPDRNEASTLRGQAFRGSAAEEAVARGVPPAQVEAERAHETEAARAADAGPPSDQAPLGRTVPATSPPPPLAVVTDNVPVPTPVPPPGGGGLATLRGSTAAGTAEGRIRLDAPDVATTIAPETPTRRYGLQRDGTYVDAPVGDAVALPEDAVTVTRKIPARTAGDPGSGAGTAGSSVRNVGPPRQRAAPPDSGGLATTVQAPPSDQAPLGRSVDTGTNTPATSTTNVSAGPAVDTNQPPVADDSGFMGKPDIWSFLTSAGLGAMASGSPDFLGAIGAGGTAGINQLGVLRKDQRERIKNLADAQFQKDRIKLGYYDTDATNKRTDKTIASQENIAKLQDQGATGRTVLTNQNTKDVAAMQDRGATGRTVLTTESQERSNRESNAGALERTNRQGEINREVEERRAQLVLEGKDLDRRSIYDLVIEKGGTVDEARGAALGHNPIKPDKPTPMSEKDVTLTHDMVANKLFGAGVSGTVLIEKLPPEISIEYQEAVGSKQDAASAYAAGLAVLMKHGITGKPDGSWWPGNQPELTVPKFPPAAAPAGGGGGGNPRYVQGQGIVR